jgi:hypothetical protein
MESTADSGESNFDSLESRPESLESDSDSQELAAYSGRPAGVAFAASAFFVNSRT